MTYGADMKPIETVAQTWNVETNAEGQARLPIKASQAGQYRLAYKLTDAKQRTIEGAVLLIVLGEGFDGSKFRFNDLELIAEKREYTPGDKVRLLVNTNRVDSTVALFLRPNDGEYSKPQLLHLKGKSLVYEIERGAGRHAELFCRGGHDFRRPSLYGIAQIIVPPEKRVVNVAVEPSAHDYKPGAKSETRLKLTDPDGKPVRGSIVVSVYDKSVEYISGGSNVADIRKFFWEFRRWHTVATDSSLDRLGYNLVKSHEMAMSEIGVFGGSVDEKSADEDGVTFGPALGKSRGPAVGMSSPMAVAGAPLFDAEARQSQADSTKHLAAPAEIVPSLIQPAVRSQFADTAYWNARLEADADGFASVAFATPENLTTWKIRWTLAPGTRVGEGSAEIVTTKNLLVRMEAPRFFVETDEVVLSAIVHNRLKSSKSVRTVIEFDGKSLAPLDPIEKTVEVAAGGEMRVDWRVKAAAEGEAVVRMKALTDEESDAVEDAFPRPRPRHAQNRSVLRLDSPRPRRGHVSNRRARAAADQRHAVGDSLFAQAGRRAGRRAAVSRPLSAQHDRLHA